MSARNFGLKVGGVTTLKAAAQKAFSIVNRWSTKPLFQTLSKQEARDFLKDMLFRCQKQKAATFVTANPEHLGILVELTGDINTLVRNSAEKILKEILGPAETNRMDLSLAIPGLIPLFVAGKHKTEMLKHTFLSALLNEKSKAAAESPLRKIIFESESDTRSLAAEIFSTAIDKGVKIYFNPLELLILLFDRDQKVSVFASKAFKESVTKQFNRIKVLQDIITRIPLTHPEEQNRQILCEFFVFITTTTQENLLGKLFSQLCSDDQEKANSASKTLFAVFSVFKEKSNAPKIQDIFQQRQICEILCFNDHIARRGALITIDQALAMGFDCNSISSALKQLQGNPGIIGTDAENLSSILERI
ncbi:hypothetical protein KJ780_04515 [Candidatus Micrarchaeota archaeon]|nr:hypothetical protein [Candidatus Micrarchaeota archaeon]